MLPVNSGKVLYRVTRMPYREHSNETCKHIACLHKYWLIRAWRTTIVHFRAKERRTGALSQSPIRITQCSIDEKNKSESENTVYNESTHGGQSSQFMISDSREPEDREDCEESVDRGRKWLRNRGKTQIKQLARSRPSLRRLGSSIKYARTYRGPGGSRRGKRKRSYGYSHGALPRFLSLCHSVDPRFFSFSPFFSFFPLRCRERFVETNWLVKRPFVSA